MSRRARIGAFGSAAVAVAAGVGAALAGGLIGQVAAIALITLGLGAALLLTFFEVGLSEERELAREEERRRRSEQATDPLPSARKRRWQRRPG